MDKGWLGTVLALEVFQALAQGGELRGQATEMPSSNVPSLQVVPNITYQCMELNFYKIPDNIPRSTKELDLSFNPLRHLGSHSFSSFPELQVLDLSR